eukprot:scaffold346_cov347-Pavlova_lutheri.AAC.49
MGWFEPPLAQPWACSRASSLVVTPDHHLWCALLPSINGGLEWIGMRCMRVAPSGVSSSNLGSIGGNETDPRPGFPHGPSVHALSLRSFHSLLRWERSDSRFEREHQLGEKETNRRDVSKTP